MTLDPVHYEGIARLARRIGGDVDDDDHEAFADRVWEEFLDPLVEGGATLLEPLGEQRRREVDPESVALADQPYDEVHGLDAGTVTPTTYKNGLTMDLAHAAMSATPSDLDLHRGRTVVAAVHTNDATVGVDEDWHLGDRGYFRSRIARVPTVRRYADHVVATLALYLAESEHALTNAEVVSELLVLDGPIYPKALLRWDDRDPELRDLLHEEALPRDVLENYVRLVEGFVERDLPLVGFVKNPASKTITRAVRSRGAQAPWVDDATFFERVLARPDEESEDRLAVTNWFRSRGGADRPVSAAGDALGVDRRLDDEAYEVTFCTIYDPRESVTYRLEAPYGITRDPERRERLVRYALGEVAARAGPPLSVSKADELARISRGEKESLRDTLEDALESEPDRSYDDLRWPDGDR